MRKIIGVLAVFCATPGAIADETAETERLIERIVVTGSKRAARTAAGSVSYLDQTDLEKFDYDDIHRILRSVPGVNIQEEDGFGLRPNIGLRGTGLDRSSKIALMEDGILIAPAPYAAPSAYYFPRAGRMAAVEVTKGAAAIKYGPLTTGGAIHMFSTEIPEEFSGRADVHAGSYGAWRSHFSIGSTLDGRDNAQWGYLVEAYRDSSEGFKELDGGGNTGFDIEDYVGKLKWTSSEGPRHSLEIKVQYSDEISNETYLGLTEADYRAQPYRRYRGSQLDVMDNEHSTFQATHYIQLGQEIDLTTIAYRTDFQRNWFKLDKVADPTEGLSSIGTILNDPATFSGAYQVLIGAAGFTSDPDALHVKNNNRAYFAEGIQSVLGYGVDVGSTSHEIEFSVRFHQDEMDRYQWVDMFSMNNGTMVLTNPGVPGTDSNRIDSAEALSLYLIDEINIGDLMISPGLRYERIATKRVDYGKTDPDRTGTNRTVRKNENTVWIPGIGVTYTLSDSLLFTGGIHKGFSHAAPGKTAEAEESINWEAGFRYNRNALSLNVIGFYSDYSNLVGTCTNSTGGGCNIGDQFDGGEASVKGLELSAGTDLASHSDRDLSVPLSISYTWTDAVFDNAFASGFGPWGTVENGFKLPYISEHQLTATLGVELQNWRLQISGNYASATRSQAGTGPIPSHLKVGPRTVFDVATEFYISDHLSLFGEVDNIFDEVYVAARRPAGLRPGKPRSGTIGLKLRF